MDAININKNTWHYWLATKFGWKQYRQEDIWSLKEGKRFYEGYKTVPNDFCSYVRGVILGCVVTGLLGAAGLLYLTAVIDGIYFLLMLLFNHSIHASSMQGLGLFLSVVTLFIVVAIFSKKWLESYEWEWKQKRRAKKEAREIEKMKRTKDPFVKAAYASIKDKMCFKINITE